MDKESCNILPSLAPYMIINVIKDKVIKIKVIYISLVRATR